MKILIGLLGCVLLASCITPFRGKNNENIHVQEYQWIDNSYSDSQDEEEGEEQEAITWIN
jgi:hypothetical protein